MAGVEQSENPKLAFEIASGIAGRRFGVCGFDRDEGQRIEGILRKCASFAVPFHENVLAQSVHFCDALIVKIRNLSASALRAAAASHVPVLVTIANQALSEGVGGAYGWPRDFMVEPWKDEELVVRLFRLSGRSEDASRKAREPRREPLILLADDDPELSALVHATLRNDGILYQNAENGLACLRMARELAPDMIVLDVRMPEMSGFAVLETIRQDPALQTIPVVLLTGCDEPADVARAATLHADEYLVKPVSPNILLNRLRRLLAGCGRNGRRWARVRQETAGSNGKSAQKWVLTESANIAGEHT
jgi:putative two-component system response regulator